MSFLTKIVRNLAYINYRYKTLALCSLNKLPECHKSVHSSSNLLSKIFMEHENKYAFGILENKGYTVNLNTYVETHPLTEEQFKEWSEIDWSQKSSTEIFELFSSLGAYCSEQNLCISNQIFDNYIDHLTDNIQYATDKELESIFKSLALWPDTQSIRTRNYVEVWVALDDTCLKRSKDWSYDKLLSILGLFYMINVCRHSDFCLKCLNKLASKAKHLTTVQLVQTMFFIGIYRKSPFDIHNLEIVLNEKFSEFSIDELAIVSMGFFKSKTPVRDSNLVLKIIDSVIDNAKNIHEVSLAALLKLIRYSTKINVDDRIHRILDTLQYQVPRLSVMCNVHIALLGTTTMNLHEACLTKVAETVIGIMSQARVKDLERLVLSYGTFNLIPKTKECFFTKIIEELRKPERVPEIKKYGRSFACCVAYLSLLNIYTEDMINIVLSKEFLEKSYGHYCMNYGREILTLHHLADVYCSNAVTNRLSNKEAIILAKKYTDYVPSEEHKKQYNITERMVLDILRVLKQCRGGPQYVVADHILPYHQRGDIIICDDSNGAPVDIKDTFTQNNFGLLQRLPNDHIWTVLVVAGRNALINGTDMPTGPYISKIRDLEKIGYHAALVPWSLYSKLESEQAKANFLNNLIKNCRKNK